MTRASSAAEAQTETANRSSRQAPFGAPHVFVLVVVDGDDAAAVHRLVRTETIVGRGGEGHIAIEEEQISRVHCRIRVEGGVCTIFDSGSRNGTSVNGRRLAPNVGQRLRHLDEIGIGSHRLLLLSGKFRNQPQHGAS
jgi:predicted component of type VI protein secretion system